MRQAKPTPRGKDAVKRLLERHTQIASKLEGLQRKKFECEKRRDEAAVRLKMSSIDTGRLWALYTEDPDKAVAYVDTELAAMERQADALAAEVAAKLDSAEKAVTELQSAMAEAPVA